MVAVGALDFGATMTMFISFHGYLDMLTGTIC